jgi:hypothetical protein
MLKVGDPAPEITVHTDAGEEFRLSGLKGKRVVLYFYPKADTPGCTVEACEFRDEREGHREEGRGGGRHLARQAGGAGEVQTEIRSAFHSAGRRAESPRPKLTACGKRRTCTAAK